MDVSRKQSTKIFRKTNISYPLIRTRTYFIKRASLKWFYLYMKLLQSSTVFKKKNNHEVSRLKFLHEIFYNSQFKKYNCNSTHSYNRKIWVDIPSFIIFLCFIVGFEHISHLVLVFLLLPLSRWMPTAWEGNMKWKLPIFY